MAKHAAQSVAQHIADQVAGLVAEHVSQRASHLATHRDAQHARPRHAARLVVYTALLDDRQPLREVPLAAGSTADFVCLTTSRSLRSDTWQVIAVDPRLPTDPVRSERFLKIVGHPALAGYDQSLWVDNAVELDELPERFVEEWLLDADVAAPVHTFHRSLLDEAEASIELGKDDHLRVFEQLAHYLRAWPDAVDANPHWTALLARRRTPEVDAAMTSWWEHVLRYSRRDQISFGVAMAAAGVRLRSVPLPNLRSTLHRWPEGWATRAERAAAAAATAQSGRAGRHAAVPVASVGAAQLRAEIEAVLDEEQDPHAWVWELEARMSAASDNVRGLLGRTALEQQRTGP